MRMRVNFRPSFDQLLHPLPRSHTLVVIHILCVVILKDLTIDDRSRNEICVFKPSIGSLALLGMTDQWI
jgi:hypothetical protein